MHALRWAGTSVPDKLASLRRELDRAGTDAILLNDLAEIAWLLNLRGADVDCNPVFVAYAIVEAETATVYLQPEQVAGDTEGHLKESGVGVAPYEEVCWGQVMSAVNQHFRSACVAVCQCLSWTHSAHIYVVVGPLSCLASCAL